MKIRYLVIIIVVVLIFVCGYFIFFNKNKITISSSNLKNFYFGYTNGYHINADINYALFIKDNKNIVSIKPDGINKEDKLEIEVDNIFIERLVEIINKYQVYKWNGFEKYNKNVLDGNSFILNIHTNEGDIDATGYMAWPEKYREVREELDKLFMEIYNKEKIS